MIYPLVNQHKYEKITMFSGKTAIFNSYVEVPEGVLSKSAVHDGDQPYPPKIIQGYICGQPISKLLWAISTGQKSDAVNCHESSCFIQNLNNKYTKILETELNLQTCYFPGA